MNIMANNDNNDHIIYEKHIEIINSNDEFDKLICWLQIITNKHETFELIGLMRSVTRTGSPFSQQICYCEVLDSGILCDSPSGCTGCCQRNCH